MTADSGSRSHPCSRCENIAATTTLGDDLSKLFLAGHELCAESTLTTSPLFLSSGGMMPWLRPSLQLARKRSHGRRAIP